MIELAAGAEKATLGEGPIWDSRDGRLFWVDIVGGVINDDQIERMMSLAPN